MLFTFCQLGVGEAAVELFGVDQERQFGVELVRTVAKDNEILLERLPAVQCLADVRDGRVEILFDDRRVFLGPEGIDKNVLCDASILARRDIAENVARPPCR